MTAAMDFRGQDGIHHHLADGVALGHCAFHTTPGSSEATQPWFSADGMQGLVMDGWLANPDELRAELVARRARLRNHSDAELILHAYDQWGEDCVDHFEGEYGVVIWDGHRRKAMCLRDHLGMRPLHYHWDGQRLLVATDVAGVLAAGDFPHKHNAYRMAENLASEFYSDDETVWTGVMRMPLASAMLVDASGLRLWQYWSLPLDLSVRYKRDEDYYEHYRELLMDSVRRASRSQVAIGCEVSGGHDSSAIFALARRLKESARLQAPDALGFTLSGIPGTISDEIDYARDVGRFLGVPIHERARTCADVGWFEQNIAMDLDMPFFPNAQSMFSEAEMLREHGCRVVLDGEGGDEFAGGSAYFIHELLCAGRWGDLAHELRLLGRRNGAAYAAQRLFRYGLRPFAPQSFDGMMRYLHRHREPWPFYLKKGPHWVARPLRDQLAERREERRKADMDWKIRNPSKRRLWREMRDPGFQVLRDMSARMLARLGVEMRTAMYSRQYFEFISALPENLLYREGYGKHIHLKAMQNDLPRSVLDRRSKAEFSFTFEQQFNQLAPLFEHEIPSVAPDEISLDGLASLWKTYQAGGGGVWELWRIFGWYRLNAITSG
ncbi:MAG: asparagine synthetase B family protein [Novosphingobium sp.]|uniref:asparagine synthetase B family protein n=1 Tax=Novosphingobium sp. TaxID=1874826 RepID=UPI003B99551C